MTEEAKEVKEKAQKLTDKQIRFCKEYIVDFNGARAAIAAGYSQKAGRESAYELLTKAHIQAEIQRLTAQTAEKLELTAESVLRDIKKIKEDAMRKVFDKEGNEVMADRSSALKASELEGKYLSMWSEKIDSSVRIEFNRLS